MSRTVWFFADGDRAAGPVTWDALLAAARRRELTPAGRVWTPAVDGWIAAGDVPWLFGATDEAASAPAPLAEGVLAVPPPLKGTIFARSRPASPVKRLGLAAAEPWRRLVALVIDTVTVGLLSLALGGALVWAVQRAGLNGAEVERSDIFALTATVLLLMYQVAVESYWGTSLGKRLATCRVVDAYGETPFATRIVIRSVVRGLAVIGLLVILVSLLNGGVRAADQAWLAVTAPLVLFSGVSVWVRDRRALHDLAAGTWVVRR
ncbi:MAG: RDD family protein [Gemmatimonadetes bacterium]|nr:RDD family protein [Gemmatimonadota bacterium]